MLMFFISLYRAIPVRPRCDRRRGIHSLACQRLGMSPDWCKDLPGPIPD